MILEKDARNAAARAQTLGDRRRLCVCGPRCGASIGLYCADRPPVAPHQMRLAASRLEIVRFNDPVIPEAMPLDVDYAAVITSDIPIIMRFARFDGSGGNARIGTMVFPAG